MEQGRRTQEKKDNENDWTLWVLHANDNFLVRTVTGRGLIPTVNVQYTRNRLLDQGGATRD